MEGAAIVSITVDIGLIMPFFNVCISNTNLQDTVFKWA